MGMTSKTITGWMKQHLVICCRWCRGVGQLRSEVNRNSTVFGYRTIINRPSIQCSEVITAVITNYPENLFSQIQLPEVH
ncbi:hypothetical protein PR048_026407 [Dryococelus australis]|uniref:Uncharacterized protein n=1 Tax=Dryococelus australis TaxID=614101 RepID=A0ABQ9GL77_9NEOP|nr:hypothetical protein PR048_026407 [Dryococelus australis]